MASKQPEMTNDDRFSQVMKDPRFWEMPVKERKIKIDKRFQGMFHDKKFKLNYTVDKRGRPINHSTTEDLKRFYQLSDSDSLTDSESEKNKRKKKKLKPKEKKGSDNIEKDAMVKRKKTETLVKFGTDKAKEQIIDKQPKSSTSIDNLLEVSNEAKVKKGKEKTVSKIQVAKDNQSNYVEVEQNDTKKKTDSDSKKQLKKNINVNLKNEESHQNKEKRKKSMNIVKPSILKDATEIESGNCEEDSDNGKDSWGDEESSGSDSQSKTEEKSENEEFGDNDEEEEEEESSEEESESDSGPDLARGKGNVETSSDEDDDFADVLKVGEQIEHSWGELAKDAPRGDEITRRLAVCNMDWDRIKAKDLLVLFNSFKPTGGVVFSVKIYPSEFGKERLQEEQMHGPLELVHANLPDNAEEDTEEQRIAREKVRDYQFKRLKYYYAVVDCDSPETANKLYEECDGMEYESSCSFLDLRFIPDVLTFEDGPRDVAADVDLAPYKPKYFTTAALGTSKGHLTWDETDPDRAATLMKRFSKDDVSEMDFQAYLASSSEEDDDEELQQDEDIKFEVKDKKTKKDDEQQILKYKELLKTIQGKEEKPKDMEMEIKWVPGLKESTEAIVKKKLERKGMTTPWEQYLQKIKEKKKQKRKNKRKHEDEEAKDAEGISDDEIPSDVDLNDSFFTEELRQSGLQQKKSNKNNKKLTEEKLAPKEEADLEKQKAEMSLLMMDEDEEERKHFNYDKIVEHQNLGKMKKKKIMKKQGYLEEDKFQVDVGDSRFQAMYTSHLFNLDPSDPAFKKTTATKSILEEKSRRRQEQQKQAAFITTKECEFVSPDMPAVKKSVDPALSMLIKSVRAKTEQFHARKKQKAE
uniref:ESF1-like protein n=1 Tax=Callorhinchus milii TaxID=7868 RepID=V9KF90_CALMI